MDFVSDLMEFQIYIDYFENTVQDTAELLPYHMLLSLVCWYRIASLRILATYGVFGEAGARRHPVPDDTDLSLYRT